MSELRRSEDHMLLGIDVDSRLTSRRKFLGEAALSGAFLCAHPRILEASAQQPTAAGCRMKTRPAFGPGLEAFISKLSPGSDRFVCEKHAAELEALLSRLGTAMLSSAQDTVVLGSLAATDLAFHSLLDNKVATLRQTGAVRAERVEFTANGLKGRQPFLDQWKTLLVGVCPHLVCRVSDRKLAGPKRVSVSP